jgi:rhodanese-related sulfurtransferase
MTDRKLVALFLSILFIALTARAEDLAASISPQDLSRKMKDGTAPLIVDVRTPQEFAAGHIPGALNIPHDQIGRHLDEMKSDRGVALYCMVGPRARLGEQKLLEAGIERVLHIDGGFSAWKAAGLPTSEE